MAQRLARSTHKRSASASKSKGMEYFVNRAFKILRFPMLHLQTKNTYDLEIPPASIPQLVKDIL
jgi:hypothetical protein